MAIQSSPKSPADRNLTLYEAMLEGISDLGCLVYSKELVLYIQARWAGIYASVIPAQIERLMLSRLRKYETEGLRAAQPVLCPALTAVRGEAIFRLMARSDWPLESRLVAATTGRLRYLQITARVCNLLLNEGYRFDNHSPLLKLVSTLARGLPGITVKYEQYDLKSWRDLASELIITISDKDKKIRIDSATSLLTVTYFNEFWGVPEEGMEELGV